MSSGKRSALEFEDARRIVIETTRSLVAGDRLELISLDEAHGRILAAPLLADRDIPALRRSLRDGFAVTSADLPGVLAVRGEVRAGESGRGSFLAGRATEIMTGAPVPEGSDAVVMIEHVTRFQDDSGRQMVKIESPAEIGQFINARGAEAAEGAVLVAPGTRLDASHVAALASVGQIRVEVFRRPSVAILATGDEIVEVGEQPLPHQVRNSNSFMLASLVRSAGGLPTILPIAPDRSEDLRTLLERGRTSDFLLVTGGVSAGKYDLVKPALRELGAEFLFERVRIQPGQPTAFGIENGKPLFGLPGNPGSTLITFQLFARPVLEVLGGLAEPLLPLLSARFEAPFGHKGGLTRFLPAHLSADGQHLRHIPWQGSSDIPALARANAFLVADHDRLTWETGDEIRVMLKP
ncbi:MAG TPA: gephyrin-like molybdotransferase Glp [Bryobacteraceae bacterium]|jgi:molybdopterin molybdotransferase|nr:gephyrin-like molybdotransferase Glp [Bryobacteraceae bacterium]